MVSGLWLVDNCLYESGIVVVGDEGIVNDVGEVII